MKTLLLIDANSLIHRAYHALPPLTSPGGEPIGAIYGLSSMLLKILAEQKPDYVAGAFDTPEPTFRDAIFEEYKAQRPELAEELASQISRAPELFEKFGIFSLKKPGFEADDVIATLVESFKDERDLKIVILTGDLDTLQLVEGDKIVVETPKKGVSDTVIYDEDRVRERYSLKPAELLDYKALVGDPSDNVRGVPGVGPKTAAKLIQEYGNLENMYANLDATDKLSQKILAHREGAYLAKKVLSLEMAVPLKAELEDLKFSPNKEKVAGYFAELGFQSLIKRLS